MIRALQRRLEIFGERNIKILQLIRKALKYHSSVTEPESMAFPARNKPRRLHSRIVSGNKP